MPGPDRGVLHERLRAHGVTTLGRRLAIINALAEPTLECLAHHLAASAPVPRSINARFEQQKQSPIGDENYAEHERRFVVVHSQPVFIRERADVKSQRVGTLFTGDDFAVAHDSDGWVQLAAHQQRQGWVLRDARHLGLGELIRPLPDPKAQSLLADLPPLTVRAADGLCNRLRVVLSYAQHAQRLGRALVVWWPLSDVCNGHFTEAFEPLPGVSFVDERTDARTFGFCPDSHDYHAEVRRMGEAAITACYAALRPTAAVQQRVDENLLELRAGEFADAGFISLHVRRTDHWGSSTTDEDFLAFVGAHPHHAVYVATDNATTQSKFLDHAVYGPRVRACKRIVPTPHQLRQTSLSDAAVDILTAAEADGPFKGCYSSSFSDTIAHLRRLRGKAQHDDHQLTDAQFQMGVTLATPGGHATHSPGMPMDSHRGGDGPWSRPSDPSAYT